GLKAKSGAIDNPWDTIVRTESGDAQLADERIVEVLDRLNGKLLILGDPGSGKTTTLLTLARDLLARAEADEGHPIPVVFNLSSWSEKQAPLAEWLVEELSSKYQVPRKVGQKWVAEDELLLLLDGLDEVTATAREACVNAINTYRTEHGFVDVVVCSRIKDYEALANQLRLNGAIVIQPLDDEQISMYLGNLGADARIISELIERDQQLRELAQSPLMLSIMVLAYRGRSAGEVPDYDDIETQREHLFDVYVARMFERRLSQEPHTPEQTRHYLGWLAGKMMDNGLSVFHIEDLQPWWLPKPEQVRRFPNQIRWMNMVYLVLAWSITSTSFYIASDATSLWGLGLVLLASSVVAGVYAFMLTHPLAMQDLDKLYWPGLVSVSLATSAYLMSFPTAIHQTPRVLLLTPFYAVFGIILYRIHVRAMIKLGTKPDRIVYTENIKFRWLHWYPTLPFELFAISFLVVVLGYNLFPFSL
ncbi:MAG: NACHT domain-containing protein, partial [Chloroflexota bacterium]